MCLWKTRINLVTPIERYSWVILATNFPLLGKGYGLAIRYSTCVVFTRLEYLSTDCSPKLASRMTFSSVSLFVHDYCMPQLYFWMAKPEASRSNPIGGFVCQICTLFIQTFVVCICVFVKIESLTEKMLTLQCVSNVSSNHSWQWQSHLLLLAIPQLHLPNWRIGYLVQVVVVVFVNRPLATWGRAIVRKKPVMNFMLWAFMINFYWPIT